MSDARASVRDSAKYLRNVRPIDPEELSEYVEGTPHPAVVAQHLRELAVDLGLVEREDGTFVPASEEPVQPPRLPVERFPDRCAQALEDLLVDRYGPDWHEGVSGDLLRSTIRRFKSDYLAGRPVAYDEDVAAGYAIYHLPGYYAAIQYAISASIERGLIPRTLRVLDVGAGTGGPALGLFDLLPEDALVDYHAVEPSAAADVLERLLAETGPNVHATVHRETAEAFDFEGVLEDGADGTGFGFDLISLCNVLSELEDPETVLRRYLGALADDGSLLAMAPADKETSIGLRRLERSVEGERISSVGTDRDRDRVTVFGPTVRLWPEETPSDRGWTFDVRPDLSVPDVQRRLDRVAGDADHDPGEFVNVDVQFSWSILRLDGRRRTDLDLDPGRFAKMAEMAEHVPNRIDLAAAKVSPCLSGEGAGRGSNRGSSDSNPIFKVSDGSERVDHYAVLTRETGLNRPLREAEYGDVLSFESVLALWNDDEGAYNLVVDEQVVVDRIA